MKKNIIGHMIAPRETAGKTLRRMDLIRKLLCLLLALMIWLIVVNVTGEKEEAPLPDVGMETPVDL